VFLAIILSIIWLFNSRRNGPVIQEINFRLCKKDKSTAKGIGLTKAFDQLVIMLKLWLCREVINKKFFKRAKNPVAYGERINE
jgi:hypothetical protein